MKIAIASDIYYPMTNGVAVFSHNLALGLAKRGHEVMVICPSFNGEYHEDMEQGVKTVHLTSAKFPFYPDQINEVPKRKEFLGMPVPRLAYKNGIWWSTRALSEVKKALDEFQPDVIHLQTAETIAIAVMYLLRNQRVAAFGAGVLVLTVITGDIEILAMLMLYPIMKYDGSRGKNMKMVFYAFYPMHLLILALICMMIGV